MQREEGDRESETLAGELSQRGVRRGRWGEERRRGEDRREERRRGEEGGGEGGGVCVWVVVGGVMESAVFSLIILFWNSGVLFSGGL